jgi:ADP-ribose pyrophosphatase YjhB (NUDIX family)
MINVPQVAADPIRALKTPTKAGGLVVRAAKSGHEALLISSVSRPGRWTLPKGSLEFGEHPESTASREIAEEAGVRGRLIRILGLVVRENHVIAFYLFRFRNDVEWLENGVRERRWVALDKAERHLRQADLHEIVEAARRALRSR